MGQPPKLSEKEINEIIAWISASEDNHHKPYHQVIKELGLEVTPMTLRLALQKWGYSRCKALQSHRFMA